MADTHKAMNRYSPIFPREEYEIRYKKARKLMESAGVDALLATDPTNYLYLGGHLAVPQMPRSRPFIAILPFEGSPILIGHEPYKEILKAGSWIENVRTWSGLPFTAKPVKEALEESGLAKARIGTELGDELRLGISYNDFMELKNSLSMADFVDATEIFWKLRIIKTQREVDSLKKACEITSKMFEWLFPKLKIGMTEKEIARMIDNFYHSEGASAGFITVNIYPGALSGGWPTDRALKKGDTLFVDTGSSYKGYKSDFSRHGIVGKPMAKQKEMHDLEVDLTWKCVDMVKPGIRTSDIAKAHKKELENLEIQEKPFGRFGHGLGLGGLELPSINQNDDTILEPGMVITLETEVSTTVLKREVGSQLPEFHFCIEENVLVTEEGCEILSTANRDLYVI